MKPVICISASQEANQKFIPPLSANNYVNAAEFRSLFVKIVKPGWLNSFSLFMVTAQYSMSMYYLHIYVFPSFSCDCYLAPPFFCFLFSLVAIPLINSHMSPASCFTLQNLFEVYDATFLIYKVTYATHSLCKRHHPIN